MPYLHSIYYDISKSSYTGNDILHFNSWYIFSFPPEGVTCPVFEVQIPFIIHNENVTWKIIVACNMLQQSVSCTENNSEQNRKIFIYLLNAVSIVLRWQFKKNTAFRLKPQNLVVIPQEEAFQLEPFPSVSDSLLPPKSYFPLGPMIKITEHPPHNLGTFCSPYKILSYQAHPCLHKIFRHFIKLVSFHTHQRGRQCLL